MQTSFSHLQIFTALRAKPSASLQNAEGEFAISTTARIEATQLSICSRVTISGGATFKTVKLLPQICVRMLWSRNNRITSTCPNIAG